MKTTVHLCQVMTTGISDSLLLALCHKKKPSHKIFLHDWTFALKMCTLILNHVHHSNAGC